MSSWDHISDITGLGVSRNYVQVMHGDVSEHDYEYFYTYVHQHPFAEWNKGAVVDVTHCWTFACNALPDISTLEPGRYIVSIPDPGLTSGKFFDVLNPSKLKEALIVDGFIPENDNNQKTPDGTYFIAAYLSSSSYHFYRRHEKSRIWYHKPGWNEPVSCYDASRQIITDPQKANRKYQSVHSKEVDDFKEFIGYFISPPKGLKLNIKIMPYEESPEYAMRSLDRTSLRQLCNHFGLRHL